jgi:O-antigen ligase
MTTRWQFGQPWARLAVGLIPAFVLAVLLTNGSVSMAIRVEAALVLIVTLVRPAIGLMIVAFLAPLGDIVVPIFGGPPLRHAETLVVAFLAGWLLFRTDRDEPRVALPTALASAIWVFAGVVIASVTSTALQLYREDPAALRSTIAALTQSYLLNADDPIGFHSAGRLLEGLGLMAAAAEIGQRNVRDRLLLLACLVASGVVASIASGLLAIGVAPAQTLARQAANGLPRYSAVTSDVNAAASSYLLLVFVAVGVAALARRTRLAWLLAATIMVAAIALTGSGSALIASTVVVAAVMLRRASAAVRHWKIVGLLVLVLMVGSAVAFVRSARSLASLDMRAGFTQTSLRLIEAQPVFGIGAGRYYPLSKLTLPPWLSLVYGRENAHDYYLQIAAELGIVGSVAFIWVLGTALTPQLKRAWRGEANGLMAGCLTGSFAYLVTALAGHPFLVPETAIPFWAVLGLAIHPPGAPARSAWSGRVAIGLACVLVLTAPFRGVVPVRLLPGDFGFGPWQTDSAGRAFREADPAASLFVGPAVPSVEIPMRLSGDRSSRSALVAVIVPGSSRTETRVGAEWTTQVISLPGAEVMEPSQRINLAISVVGDPAPARGSGHVDIGQIRVVAAK